MELKLWEHTLHHPKIMALPDRDFRRLIEIAAYLAAAEDVHREDGVLYDYELNRMRHSPRAMRASLQRLCEAQILERNEHLKCWRFPDWTTRISASKRGLLKPEQIAWGQQPLSRVLRSRGRHAERMRTHRASSKQGPPPDWAFQAFSNPKSNQTHNREQEGKQQ